MNPSEHYENIKKQILAGDLDDAFRLLLVVANGTPLGETVDLQFAQYNAMKTKSLQGFMTHDQTRAEETRITSALLALLNTPTIQPSSHSTIYLSPTRRPPLPSHLVLGRKDDLQAIHQKLENNNELLLLNGMGGVGKSTLAGHYMEEYALHYRHIAWVRFTGDFANSSLQDINDYRALGLPDTQIVQLSTGEPEQRFQLLVSILENLSSPNLLIVDNLNTQQDTENAAAYKSQLPNGWKTLLTAREHTDSFPHHSVGVLPLEEARALFLRCYGASDAPLASHASALTSSPDPTIDPLLEYVGCHTLVVEFAAKTAAKQSWTPQQMLDRLKKDGLAHLDTRAKVSTAHSREQRHRMADYIAALFDINLAHLNREERWLLANLSMLPAFAHAGSVLEEMLFFGVSRESDRVTASHPVNKPSADDLYFMLNGLCDKGFLEQQPAQRPFHPGLETPAEKETGYFMHPVMQEVVRDKEKPDVEMCKEMVGYFNRKFYGEDDSSNPAYAFSWLPYGDALARRLPEHKRTATLANNLMTIYYSQGNLTAALEWQLKDIAIKEKVLGKNHSSLANSYNNLSTIYYAKGELDAALEWQLKAEAIREKVLGENHPGRAQSYNNLSQIYQAKGDLNVALEWQLKAKAIREKVLGENHPFLANSYNNLSQIYQAKGDLNVALEWQLKAKAIREKVLGENHPSLANSYNNLSQIYKAKGDLDAALEWQLKAIDIREKVLGENHPSLANSYNNLSTIYQDKGDLNVALEWQLKAKAIREKTLGENHPSLANSYNNLSTIYQDKGELDAALEWQLKAIAIREKALGENHPLLALSLTNHAIIYYAMNEPATALPHIRRAVEIYQRCFPDGHPRLDKALRWLADIEKRASSQE